MRKLYILLLCLATMQVSAQAPFIFNDFDLNPDTTGQRFSRPAGFVSALGKVFFTAYHDTTGYEPWVTNGTTQGTMLLKNIANGTSYSNCGGYVEYNGKVYFSASSYGYNRELWETDGTPTGTQKVMLVSNSSNTLGLYFLRVFNGKMYFVVHDYTYGEELWVSDGTANGTQVLKDINPGSADGFPRSIHEHNGKLYFRANDGTNGPELWVTDGTTNGTVMLKDIVPGSGGSGPGAFFSSGTDLYFRAYTPATGYELWKTDGTANGTQMITDITGDSTDGIAFQESDLMMVNYNSKVYFQGKDTTHGAELWVTDGTANGTMLVKDIRSNINLNKGSGPIHFGVYKNKLYFSAADTSSNIELWVTDGTTNGTLLFKEFQAGPVYGGSARLLTVYKDHLYFKAQLDTGSWQLIRSDGTVTGTKVVRPSTATVQDDCVQWFTSELFINPTDSAMYFGAEYTSTGYELWSLKDTTGSSTNPPGNVSKTKTNAGFSLYPNPNNGSFTLALENANISKANLQVYDIVGRMCYTTDITESKTIITTNLPAGMYFVKLQVDGATLTKRITVE